MLAKVCATQLGFERVCAVALGAEAEAALAREPFDLLILDIDLPDRDGFAVAETAAALEKPPRALGMSAYCDEFMVHRIMTSSLHGFLDKTEQTVETLQEAIRAVCAGRYYFTEAVKRKQRELRENPQAFPRLLTEHECHLLSLIGAGKTHEEVAKSLGLAAQTVLWHRKLIMRKLGLHTAVELVLFAVEKGFVRPGGTSRADHSLR